MAAHQHTPLLDIVAVAERLDMSVRWVRRKVAAREIPFIKLGHFVRFDPEEIDAWLQRARVPTAAEWMEDERHRAWERHAGDDSVAGPPFRPASSIRSTRAAQPPGGRDRRGLDSQGTS